jgi:hypothetical protein
MKDATDFILAFGMLATGSINSIVTKLADGGCQRDGENRPLLYDPKMVSRSEQHTVRIFAFFVRLGSRLQVV